MALQFTGKRNGLLQGAVWLCLIWVQLWWPAAAQIPACPPEEAEALGWLERMSHASVEMDYQGVVTVQRGDDMQVVQVAHSVSGDTSSEIMTRLTGQGARVARKQHPLDCIHPGSQLLQLGAALARGDCGIARHYRFKLSEGERVAGRKAVRIKIDPRDLYRFGYVMDLDRETGLLLRIRTLDRGDQTLEKSQFANLSFTVGEVAGADIEVEHTARHPNPQEESSEQLLTGVAWQINWLPSGFVATDSAGSHHARKTYTDGLAVFSVFLEELAREIRPGEGMVRRGATISYSRGLHLGSRPIMVTVIGEVPLNTARMVADSITAQGVAHAD